MQCVYILLYNARTQALLASIMPSSRQLHGSWSQHTAQFGYSDDVISIHLHSLFFCTMLRPLLVWLVSHTTYVNNTQIHTTLLMRTRLRCANVAVVFLLFIVPYNIRMSSPECKKIKKFFWKRFNVNVLDA